MSNDFNLTEAGSAYSQMYARMPQEWMIDPPELVSRLPDELVIKVFRAKLFAQEKRADLEMQALQVHRDLLVELNKIVGARLGK